MVKSIQKKHAKTVSSTSSYGSDCPAKCLLTSENAIPRDVFHHEEEVAMDVEQRELEVLDEGRESTEELNACCTGTKARL